MTPKEHQLMIFMFARQQQLTMAVVEALKSHGIVGEDQDWLAFVRLVQAQENENPSYYEQTDSIYRQFAEALGIQVPPESKSKS